MTRTVTGQNNRPVTLTSLRQYIKHQDDTDTSEIAEISAMLAATVTYIENKTGLSLAEKTVRETLEYRDDGVYELSLAPFGSISSVKGIDIEGTETEFTLNSEYYLQGDYVKSVITSSIASNSVLQVEYSVGYGSDNTEQCPDDIILAIKNNVFHWYYNRDLYREMMFNNQVSNIIQSYKREF